MEPLFKSESVYDFETYKQYNKTIFSKVQKMPLKIGLYFVLLVILAVFCLFFLSNGIPIAVGIFVAIVILSIMLPLIHNRNIKKTWDSNKAAQNVKVEVSFYDDYIEQTSQSGSVKIEYNKLYRIEEDKIAFYLMIANNQSIIVKKDNCSDEMINFIRNIKI